MELAFLRKLIYTYEHSWYIRVKNWISSKNDQVIIIYIKRCVQSLWDQPDSYQLRINDLFQLVRLLYLQSNIKQIQRVQRVLSFELAGVKPLINMLIYFNLFNKKNFLKIHKINKIETAIAIVNKLVNNNIVIHQETLDMLVFLHQDAETIFSENNIDCLILLAKNNLWKKNILHYVLSDHIFVWLIDIISSLFKMNLLTEYNLIEVAECKNIQSLNSILIHLNKSVLDDDLLIALCDCNISTLCWINIVIPMLLNNNLLSKKIFSLLVCSNNKLLMAMNFTLKSVMMNHEIILDENTFYLLHTLLVKKISSLTIMDVLKNFKKKSNYKSLIKSLAKYDLFSDSRLNIINRLNDTKREFLLTIFVKIANANLAGLERMFDLISSFQCKLTNEKMINQHLSLAINHLLSNHLLNINNLIALLSLKLIQTQRMCSLIMKLSYYHLLNQSSLTLLYQSNAPLPTIKEKKAWIESKHLIKLSQSRLITEDYHSIFIEHNEDKKYAESFLGKVKKGYNEKKQIMYAIKKPKGDDDFFLLPFDVTSLQQCKREVKYNLLLGREAFYFFHKKVPRLVVSWQNGCELGKLTEAQIRVQPIVSRLKWLISLLSDLSMLHDHYRCHNDIKLDNVIVDIQNESLKLIDFGLASRPKEAADGKNFYYDMINLAAIIPTIFPEIHFTQCQQFFPSIELIMNNALVILYRSMTQGDIDCCRSSDALTFCQELLNHHADLNQEQVKEIASRTITRNTIMTEDILHCSLCCIR